MAFVDPMQMDPYSMLDPLSFTDPFVHPKDYGSMMQLEDNLYKTSTASLGLGLDKINTAYANRGMYGTPTDPGMVAPPARLGGVPTQGRGAGYDPASGQFVPMGPGGQEAAQGGANWQQLLSNPVGLAALVGGGLLGRKALKKLLGGRELAGGSGQGFLRSAMGQAPFKGANPGAYDPAYMSWTPEGGTVRGVAPRGLAGNVARGFVNPATGKVAVGPLLGRLGSGAALGALGAEAVNAVVPASTASAVGAGAAQGAGLGGSLGSVIPGVGTAVGAGTGAGAGAAIAYIADAKNPRERGRRAGDVMALANPLTAAPTAAAKIGGLIPGKTGDVLEAVGNAPANLIGAGANFLFGGGGDEEKPKAQNTMNAREWLADKAKRGFLDVNELAMLDAKRDIYRSMPINEKGDRASEKDIKRQIKADYLNHVMERRANRQIQRETNEAQKIIDQMYAPYIDTYIAQGLNRGDMYEGLAAQMSQAGFPDYAAAAQQQAGSAREYTLKTAMAYKNQAQQIPYMEQAQQLAANANFIRQQQTMQYGPQAGMLTPGGNPMMTAGFVGRPTNLFRLSASNASLLNRLGAKR